VVIERETIHLELESGVSLEEDKTSQSLSKWWSYEIWRPWKEWEKSYETIVLTRIEVAPSVKFFDDV